MEKLLLFFNEKIKKSRIKTLRNEIKQKKNT